MKGPGARAAYDVRRIWQCPHCGRRAKAEGHVVSRVCFCKPEGVWMRLTDEHRPPRDPFVLRDPLSGTGPYEEDIANDDATHCPVPAAHAGESPSQHALPAKPAGAENQVAPIPETSTQDDTA
jgi:hypothetical protein